MSVAKFNQLYEEIIHSKINSSRKDWKLAELMTEMERVFKIPISRKVAWENENRAVIALYRKISLSRSF